MTPEGIKPLTHHLDGVVSVCDHGGKSWTHQKKLFYHQGYFFYLYFCAAVDAILQKQNPNDRLNLRTSSSAFVPRLQANITFSLPSSLQTSPVRTTPQTHLLLTTLRGPANTLISVEGNILLCNDHKEGWPGQRWGRPLTPSEPAECAGDHGAADELSDESWTVHLGDLWCHPPDSRRMCL